MRYLAGDMAWEMLPMKTQQQRKAEGPALLADLPFVARGRPKRPSTPEAITVPVARGRRLRHPGRITRMGCEAMAKMFGTDVQWIDGAGHGGHMSHPGPFASFVRRCVSMRSV